MLKSYISMFFIRRFNYARERERMWYDLLEDVTAMLKEQEVEKMLKGVE